MVISPTRQLIACPKAKLGPLDESSIPRFSSGLFTTSPTKATRPPMRYAVAVQIVNLPHGLLNELIQLFAALRNQVDCNSDESCNANTWPAFRMSPFVVEGSVLKTLDL